MITSQLRNATILAFLPRPSGTHKDTPSFQPHTVRRDSDSEVFAIGDTVSNGTQMKGVITGFNMMDDEIFVSHTWSDVGMNLGSLYKVVLTPSQYQIDDEVLFVMAQGQ